LSKEQGAILMIKESQDIEWKQNWHDDYLKWICGFANAQGGRVYIGKDDSGQATGLKNAKKLLECDGSEYLRGKQRRFCMVGEGLERSPLTYLE
jgi:predicted HTH transcriptional regulator